MALATRTGTKPWLNSISLRSWPARSRRPWRAIPRWNGLEPWPQSNRSTFAFRGALALAFNSAGAFHLAHFPADTIDRVSVAKLAEVVEVEREIVVG